MEDWIAALKVTATRELYSKPGIDPHDLLRGKHSWQQTSHARPTYCNVCRDALSGVTSHGLSCEICKLKVHKRCVLKAINNCKWSTLASIGKDIIEDKDGNILMPHQWMEGNLPVASKCAVCDRTCGSVLRLQDWRCLWCRATVHTACRPNHPVCCNLGPCRLSTVPPTSLHSVGGDEAWEGVRPPACSPLLVFVNSKSGDNQGVKFLRRFKQLLNPGQVFDLIGNGPGLGLRLFRHFDPFRILVCSGDGSVGWVLSEIDRLNLQKQCQIGVLPLGTGNDLARVLGWGASCDDDTHLPQLLEKYERASAKMLDRWSIMTFERSISTADGSKITLNTSSSQQDTSESLLTYEDRVTSHLTKILVSDDNEEIIQTAKALCDVIKALSRKAAEDGEEGDPDFVNRCHLLKSKLDRLLQTVQTEPSDEDVEERDRQDEEKRFESRNFCDSRQNSEESDSKTSNKLKDVTDEEKLRKQREGIDWRKESLSLSVTSQTTEKSDEEVGASYVRTRKQSIKKDLLLGRANSLKKAVRHIMEHSSKSPEPPYSCSPGSQNSAQFFPSPTQLTSAQLTPTSPCQSEFVLGPPSNSSGYTSPHAGKGLLKVQSKGSYDESLMRPSSTSPMADRTPRDSDCSFNNPELPAHSEFVDCEEHITSSLEMSLSGGTHITYHSPSELSKQYASRPPTKHYDRDQDRMPFTGQGTLGSDPDHSKTNSNTEVANSNIDLNNQSANIQCDIINHRQGESHPDLVDGILRGLKMSTETVSEMGHIDSSETSDISPEGSVVRLKHEVNRKASLLTIDEIRTCEDTIVRRHSDHTPTTTRHASRENTVSYPELDNPDIEYDASNLISTSPEDISDDDFKRELNFLHDNNGQNGGRPASIAHFVEGNDIARRSIKCRHMHRLRADNDEDEDVVTAVIEKERHRDPYVSERDSRLLSTNEMERDGDTNGDKMNKNRAIEDRLQEKGGDKKTDLPIKSQTTPTVPSELLDKDRKYAASHEWNKDRDSLLDREGRCPVLPTIQQTLEREERRTQESEREGDTSTSQVTVIERDRRLAPPIIQYLDVPSMHHGEPSGLLDAANIRIKGSNGTLTNISSNFNLSDSFDSGDIGIETRHRSYTSCSYGAADTLQSPADHYSRGHSPHSDITPMPRKVSGIPQPPAVIVDPPSPPEEREEGKREERRRSSYDSCRRLSAASPSMLLHSPQSVRRISNISPDPVTNSSPHNKTLPIINPLVRLPNWPNVSGSGGLISKVLLANADALCAAAVPLMDPDESLMEGFYERCVMNNYFGIGIDAQISLDFHHKREEHPEKCRSRARNYMWYGVLGSKQWLAKTYKNLEQRVQLECDGRRIPLPSLQGIVILNIPSFMGGTNFWGGTKEDEVWLAPGVDDKILEVVAVFGTVQMAASRLMNLQSHRIAQCTTVQINIMGEEGVPVQVDGEAWVQPPGSIRIIHKNRVRMLARNRALENSLKSWEEKQQRAQRRNSQNKILPTPLADEELVILLGFVEVASSLVKCVKSLVLRHSSIQQDLYESANAASADLENVHPNGKLLQGLELRPAVTQLVTSVRKLHDETCQVLRTKTHHLQLSSDLESQLSTTLDSTESELNRCYLSHVDKFIHLSYEPLSQSSSSSKLLSPEDPRIQKFPQTKKDASTGGHLSWLSFRRKSGDMGGSKEGKTRCSLSPAANWGVAEVSTWLESLSLGEYVPVFIRHDIQGSELLTLTRRDLKDLGISKVGHVKRLLSAAKALHT